MSTVQFLLEWALRSSVLIVTGMLLLRAFRVKDPSVRLGAMTALLCGSLAIPLLTAVLPKLPLPVMRAAAVRVEGPVVVYDPVAKQAHPIVDSDFKPAGDGSSAPKSNDAAPTTPPRGAGSQVHGNGVDKQLNWVQAAIGLYVLIAFTLLMRLGIGFAMTLRLLRSSRKTHQTTQGIEIRESDRVASPVTLGILRPVIVMPEDWRKWGRAKVDAILAHERSHIRRNDPAVQLLSSIHRALLWHTPLSWYLHRQIVRMAEEVCDDDAVAETRDRTLYAEVLLDFMRRGVWRASWQGLPVARYGPADQRIHRILDGTALSRGFTWRGVAIILTLGLPLAYVVACARTPSAPKAEVAPVQAAVKPPALDALPGKPAFVGGQDRITGIIIRGNRAVPASWVRKNISLNPGDIYDPARVERDVATLRNTGYFEEVKDETSDDPSGAIGGTMLIFYVREKDGAVTRPQPTRLQAIEMPSTAVDANRVNASITLGDFHLGRGQYDDAIAAYQDGLKLDPSNTALQGKLDNAIIFCKKENELLNEGFNCGASYPPGTYSPSPVVAPSPPQKRITLGDFHLARGEYDDAIAAYQDALKLDPSNMELRARLADTIRFCKRDNEALNIGLKCGVTLPPDAPSPAPSPSPLPSPGIAPSAARNQRTLAAIRLGDFHLGRGEYEQAIAAYQQGLILDPSNTELRGKLDGAIKACNRDNEVLNRGLKCEPIFPPDGPSPAPRPGPLPSPSVAPSPARNREIMAAINMGDFHLERGEFEDAIAAYQEGLRTDPSNSTLQRKLHSAIFACQKENSVLNEGLECGAPVPLVKLIPSGDFSRWTKPVSKGQFVPDNNIEGGLKPIGSLTIPPMESAPSRANVVFMIGIDPNGNVTPGRKMADDNGLAPQVMMAAKAWKFEPPTVNGIPVSTNIQVIVTF